LAEGDEPVGARHEQHQQHTEASRGIETEQLDQPPRQGRQHDEVAQQHGQGEAPVAQGLAQAHQRNLQEGGIQQRDQRGP